MTKHKSVIYERFVASKDFFLLSLLADFCSYLCRRLLFVVQAVFDCLCQLYKILCNKVEFKTNTKKYIKLDEI